MARPSARRLLAELIPVLLVLICLGGGLVLIIATHRRFPPQPAPVAVKAPKPTPDPAPIAQITESPPPPKPPSPPPIDPTAPIVERIAAQAAEHRAKAQEAEQKALDTENAIASAQAEVDRLTRQEAEIQARSRELERYADLLEREAGLLTRHRDVLAQKRDQEALEFARLQTRSRDSYAVLPYRGENGTWRRPIAIECRDGTAKLQPDGRSYSILELSDTLSLRGSPIVADVARQIIEAARETPPDGARVVPYILFVIRPDGVRAYYEARGQLEGLGIAFGYELVGDDLAIDYPPASDPMHWSDGEPIQGDVLARAGSSPVNNPYIWPQAPPDLPRQGLTPAEIDRLGELEPSHGPSGTQGKPGPFPSIPDGPPINYVPDPRPLARMNAQPGSGLHPDGAASSPGSGRGGSGLGDVPSTPSRGYGSASASGSRDARGGTGLSPDGLTLQPVPSVPNAGSGLYRGSGLSPNPSTDQAGAGSAFRPGPFPSSQPGLLAQGSGTRSTAGSDPKASPEGSGTGSSVASRGVGGSASPGRGSSGSPTSGSRPGGPSGGVGTPSDVTPGSTALGGSHGVNPLGAVIARALANGSGLAGRPGAQPPNSSGSRGSDLSKQFRDELAALGVPGGLGQGQGHGQGQGASSNAGGSGSEGNGQSSDSRQSASSSGGTGPGGSAGGTGAPGMVSTLPHPAPWMNDKSLSITLACDPNGVLIHPGGYRLSRGALESTHLLHDRLKAIVNNAETHANGQPVKPKVQFVIEPGGEETFWLVRRQTVFAGTDWPATVRLVESGGLDAFTGRLRK